jgi:hypothetical protein
LRATTSSAAAEGVAARTSAAKSAMVTSVSWPTAEMTAPATARSRARRLLVEGPILDRSATSSHDHRVHARDPADGADPARDVERGAVALNARRPDDQVQVAVARVQDLDDVADRGSVERGDDADLSGQRRQRALARRVEETLGLQAFLELFERQLKGAQSLRFEVLAHEPLGS